MRWGRAGAVLALLLATGHGAAAAPVIGGYVQVHWTPYEANENGLRQAGSGDDAAQGVSGFRLRRVRVSLADTLGSAGWHWKLEALLEKSARLTDAWVGWRPSARVELRAGQMKIPASYEAMQPTAATDFVERARVSARLPDWSLSRTPYISAFMGNRCYLRDAGVSLFLTGAAWRLQAMVGNGLGANLFVGGGNDGEFVQTNAPGDGLYGVRVDLTPRPWLRLGGHGLVNRHDDMVFNDGRTVYDLHRRSWSVDARIDAPAGAWLRGLWAGGIVDDDFYRDGRRNYEYGGWELKAMGWLRPGQLAAGARVDRYAYEVSEGGGQVTQTDWTAGVTLHIAAGGTLKVNLVRRVTDEPYAPDLDDDALLTQLQVRF